MLLPLDRAEYAAVGVDQDVLLIDVSVAVAREARIALDVIDRHAGRHWLADGEALLDHDRLDLTRIDVLLDVNAVFSGERANRRSAGAADHAADHRADRATDHGADHRATDHAGHRAACSALLLRRGLRHYRFTEWRASEQRGDRRALDQPMHGSSSEPKRANARNGRPWRDLAVVRQHA